MGSVQLDEHVEHDEQHTEPEATGDESRPTENLDQPARRTTTSLDQPRSSRRTTTNIEQPTDAADGNERRPTTPLGQPRATYAAEDENYKPSTYLVQPTFAVN